ncbi:MAG: hypothetical protein A2133_06525 [Actinobacteria bacterium RBG_16_64_13]|nr:MAG: hypothetical protein A2133_06525 [Actinobacteria bacterium RBG_16_64_13]
MSLPLPAQAVAASGLSFTYAPRIKPALSGLSFSLPSGGATLVLGPSGSGKSTLTLCLDGLIPHLVEGDYEGQVAVAGLVVGDNPVHVLAQETGLVFQDPDAQFCTLTVEDEVAFGLENLKRRPEDIETAIDRALASVAMTGYRTRHLATLSGGEKQRVALAAVLAMGPRLLVLDEPSANLDPQATSELFSLLRELAADGRHTIVIIEHKLDELIEWIDSVLVLDSEGRLLYHGDPKEAFYGRGAALTAAGVWVPQTVELVAALRERGWDVPGSPLGVDDTVASLIAAPGLVDRLRSGASVPAQAGPGGDDGSVRPRDPGEGERLLVARDLRYSYADGPSALEALSGVSMSLARGGFLAIAGRNGAGKSTLAALVSGILEPPRGQVFLEGRDITEMSAPAVSDRVGYVFQNPEHQFVSDTVLGELAFSLSPKAGRKGARHLSPSQREQAKAALDRLGLVTLAEANPYTLSQGQKRRLSVATMLIRGQAAIVLDEPTLGQDERQTARLMGMMQGFRAEGGAVAMITHDMRLVLEQADSLLVLAEGRSAYVGSPAGFFAHPELAEGAGLAISALGRVSAELRKQVGTPAGLLTARAFLQAAG